MGAQPDSGVGVELVCFVEVGGAGGEGDVERGLAGEGPGREGGMDKVGAPGGAVAGHEEGCCGYGRGMGIGGGIEAGFVGVAEVREHVDDAALMYLRRVAGDEHISR